MKTNWYLYNLDNVRQYLRKGDLSMAAHYRGVVIGLLFAGAIDHVELENALNIIRARFDGVSA